MGIRNKHYTILKRSLSYAEIKMLEEQYKTIDRFAMVMKTKLLENIHKGHWKDCTLNYLSRRLTQERKELLKAVTDNKEKPVDVIREAADVANFAMMIADNYATEWEELTAGGNPIRD
jgi:uncharacterized protein YdeI (YjbR/CyaY-like superfamily)